MNWDKMVEHMRARDAEAPGQPVATMKEVEALIARAKASEAATADWRQMMVEKEVAAAMLDHDAALNATLKLVDERDAKIAALQDAIAKMLECESLYRYQTYQQKQEWRLAMSRMKLVADNLVGEIERHRLKIEKATLRRVYDVCDEYRRNPLSSVPISMADHNVRGMHAAAAANLASLFSEEIEQISRLLG